MILAIVEARNVAELATARLDEGLAILYRDLFERFETVGREAGADNVEPLESGEGFQFESKVVGGRVPKEYIPSVEKGFKVMMEEGPLCGFPLLDFKMTLTDGGFLLVYFSQMPFDTSANAAFRHNMPNAWP